MVKYAFIVLILVIVFLVLGLSFMHGLFETMTTNVDIAVNAHQLQNPPTENNQFTVAPSEITVRTGQSVKVLFAYLARNPTGETVQLSSCDCNPLGLTILADTTSSFTMQKEQINTWSVIASSSTATTALCTCTINSDTLPKTSKSFVVTWKS